MNIQKNASATHPASIVEVLDRRNYVIRRSTNLSRQSHVIAANLDRAFIVVTLFFPEIKLPFLDRLLVTCEVYGIPATIVLNKVDIFRKEFPEQLADFHRIYESAGYPVIETSALTGEGINELEGGDRFTGGWPYLPFLRRVWSREIVHNQGLGSVSQPGRSATFR